MIWDAQEGCAHEWGDEVPGDPRGGSGPEAKEFYAGDGKTTYARQVARGQFCIHCQAWFGNLGLEPNPELYIKHVVTIFRELKRVLRNDGTLWLNMGDSYASGKGTCHNPGGGTGSFGGISRKKEHGAYPLDRGNKSTLDRAGLKPKDLVGMPWALAFALRADGWWLRSGIPWLKRSSMPESTNDRPASALEYMFLLTKSSRYFFDMDAIKIKSSGQNGSAANFARETKDHIIPKQSNPQHRLDREKTQDTGTRNFRNTDLFFESLKEPYGMIFAGDEMVGIDRNPQAMKEAHFATFPEKLIEPCILAGTSEKGCCVECGGPWERIIEKADPDRRDVKSDYPHKQTIATSKYKHDSDGPVSKTTGWKPSCECLSDDPLDGIDGPRAPFDTKPCAVLDPFGGAMTSAIVAHRHGRKFIMIELSKEYIDEIGIPRIEKATKQRGWSRFK